MTLKDELIEHWKNSINIGRCRGGENTCDIIENYGGLAFGDSCNFCPLDIIYGFCVSWEPISPKILLKALEMAKKIPAEYFEADTFNRKKFQPIYDFIQKSVD